jgi:hypothetical protein
VEITRFQLQQFTVNMKELAEWFGLEIGGNEEGVRQSLTESPAWRY